MLEELDAINWQQLTRAYGTTAAYPVAMFQANDDTIIPEMWETLSSREGTVTHASSILALGMIKNTELPIQAHLTDLLCHKTDALIKTTAAMVLVRLAPHEAPHVAKAALVEAIKNPQPITESYEQLPLIYPMDRTNYVHSCRTHLHHRRYI
ncbi:MAG: hypothetical protein AAGF95_12615 [Chloroflexota bacterium]